MNGAALRGKLDGVVEEIQEHPFHLFKVDPHHRQTALDPQGNVHSALLQPRPESVHHSLEQRPEIYLFAGSIQAP